LQETFLFGRVINWIFHDENEDKECCVFNTAADVGEKEFGL